MSALNWQAHADQLFGRMDEGLMSSTAYDTAWLLRHVTTQGTPQFPDAYRWILTHQHPDGSWGGRFATWHDRIISTLAAVTGLARIHTPEAQSAVHRGVQYLNHHAADTPDGYETIGFELIVPTLLDECQRLGLAVPSAPFAAIRAMREAKLDQVPPDWVYQPASPLAHSLEYLGETLDVERARGLIGDNGSVANSPSASAYLAQHLSDERLDQYIVRAVERTRDGGLPNVAPFEIFETAWGLYHFRLAGLVSPAMRAGLNRLRSAWSPDGVGISATGLSPDSDDSALCFKVLRDGGWTPTLDYLPRYQTQSGFRCFLYERNASVSTNIHIADSLTGLDGPAQDLRAHAVAYLRSARIDGRYWSDKWHVSPYYATAHAILAFDEGESDLIHDAAHWLLETQKPDGAWGRFAGTAEETAYSMLALMKAARVSDKEGPFQEALSRAAKMLSTAWQEGLEYPELWIGKGLYAPHLVIESAVVSVLSAWESMKGWSS